MLIKSTESCIPFTAIDGCRIREVLHPAHDPVPLSFSLAVAEVAVGARTYRHRLLHPEVHYVLEGEGLMHVGAAARPVRAGDAVYIPAHDEQWIENVGTHLLRFVALVSPPWSIEADRRLE